MRLQRPSKSIETERPKTQTSESVLNTKYREFVGEKLSGTVHIQRMYNILMIPPMRPDIQKRLWQMFSFRLVHTRVVDGEPRTELVSCYETIDQYGETITIVGAGIYDEVKEFLEFLGLRVKLSVVDKPSKAARLKLRVNRERYIKALGGSARDWQLDLIDIVNKFRCGQIKTGTGSGKSTAMRALIYALPKARILYTTPGAANVDNEFAKVRELVPEAELIGSSSKYKGGRVVFCTTGKLERLTSVNAKFDFVFVDEQHSVCTQRLMGFLVALKSHKIFAFSANYHDRIDKADRWSDILFGPLRLTRDYHENVDAGDVVKVQVRWRSMSHAKKESYRGTFQREHFGLKHHPDRNMLIIEDARRHPDDQVLILVKTTEHALLLAKELQCPAVYGDLQPEREQQLRRAGLLQKSEKPPNKNDRKALHDLFARGSIRLIVATPLWGAAVDFPHLNVLIRGDGQTSTIKGTQFSGRAGRNDKLKSRAIIYDYMDEHDETLKDKAGQRRSFYRKAKFEQVNFDNSLGRDD